MRRTLKKHTFLVTFRHVFPVEKSVPKIGVKNRPQKIGLQKVLEKLCSQLVLQPKNATRSVQYKLEKKSGTPQPP